MFSIRASPETKPAVGEMAHRIGDCARACSLENHLSDRAPQLSLPCLSPTQPNRSRCGRTGHHEPAPVVVMMWTRRSRRAVLLARVDRAALGCTAPAHMTAPEAPAPEAPPGQQVHQQHGRHWNDSTRFARPRPTRQQQRQRRACRPGTDSGAAMRSNYAVRGRAGGRAPSARRVDVGAEGHARPGRRLASRQMAGRAGRMGHLHGPPRPSDGNRANGAGRKELRRRRNHVHRPPRNKDDPMTVQPQISIDTPAFVSARSRQQQGPIESMTQFQSDAQLTPFRRDTHLCIMIRWGTFVLTNGRGAGVGGDRGC